MRPDGGRILTVVGGRFRIDKPDISDDRESPAQPVAARLLEYGAQLSYADPFVAHWRVGDPEIPRVTDVASEVADADLTVLLQPHTAFDLDMLATRPQLLFDTRGRIDRDGSHASDDLRAGTRRDRWRPRRSTAHGRPFLGLLAQDEGKPSRCAGRSPPRGPALGGRRGVRWLLHDVDNPHHADGARAIGIDGRASHGPAQGAAGQPGRFSVPERQRDR